MASSPTPPLPEKVPQTDSSYERVRADSTETRSDAKRDQPLPTGGTINGDMKTEELQGWDQVPPDIRNPEAKRHPRPDGVGGSERSSVNRSDRKEP